MNHAVSLVLSLSVQILIPAAGQSKNWYNWFEDNKGQRQIVNGVLPTLSCPYGYYRQFKIAPHEAGGVNLDGCQKCPVGVFGNSTNLTSPNCTAPCPIGTYNDEEALVSIHGCKPCPAGTYGEEEGLKTSSCSADCEGLNKMSREKQYFSMSTGLTSPDQCTMCPLDYNYHSCHWNFSQPEKIEGVRHYRDKYYLLEDDMPVQWDPIW